MDKHDEAIISRFFNALKARVNKRVTQSDGYENESREKQMKLNSEEKQMPIPKV